MPYTSPRTSTTTVVVFVTTLLLLSFSRPPFSSFSY
jgi:hypothetical protein